jgi:phosphoserine phosphatase
MSCRIYLIANAKAGTNNSSRTVIGGYSNFSEIDKEGIAQAKALGSKFLKDNLKFSKIYSSPSIRAQQTARYCLEAMNESISDVELDFFLLALDQGDWEGKPKGDIYTRKEVLDELKNNCWDFIPGDEKKGESQAMVGKRMKKWVKLITQKFSNKSILVFTHSYPIRFLLADLFNLEKDSAYKIPIKNTSISIIEFDKGKFSCLTKNDFSHLNK